PSISTPPSLHDALPIWGKPLLTCPRSPLCVCASCASVRLALRRAPQHPVPADPQRVGGDAHVDDERLAHDVRPRQESPESAVIGDRKSTRLNSSHVSIS